MDLADHPTVKAFHSKGADAASPSPAALDADRLRALCRQAGADDVGLVRIDNPAVDSQREDILRFFPAARTLVSFVCRMNREPIRNPARSVANLESHETADRVHKVGHAIVAAMEREGVRAINASVSFPMEMDRIPGKGWAISDKPIAVAAGMGRMGLNRLVIHPRFGSYVLLGTVLVAADASGYDQPATHNPCLDCKLCAKACPTGAISADGHFDFSACLTHNYREFFGGFTDWVEQLADSKNALDYRRRVTEPETAAMWQSLIRGGTYRCVYCQAVCPAGEEVIGPYLTNRRNYLRDVLTPLRRKQETVYVVPGSDAEAYVVRRYPWKRARRVGSGVRPRSIRAFLSALPLVFQREQSAGLDATYHFTFTGNEECRATVVIRDKTIGVSEGHAGLASIRVTADSQWWIGFLAKERSLAWGLLRRKLRFRGSPKLLSAFAKCFPS
ncbi:MAG: 4Fe-4S double cluster binding domain-containing protein [Phycisphaerae bacterium]|nr:4Fe-4S double cluster binding domain-containing protein [Phycisphaerae bacterium]